MNYKVFLITLLILTAISTIFICIARPKMHNSILVYSSEFKIVPQNEIEIEIESVPTITVVGNSPVNVEQSVNIANNGVNLNIDKNLASQKVTTQGVNIASKDSFTPQKLTTQGVNVTSNQKFIPQKTTTQVVNINPNQEVKISPKQTYTPQKVTTQGVNVKTTTPTTKVVTTKPTNQTAKVNSPQMENTNIKTTSPQIDIQKILDNNKKIQAANKPITSAPITTKPVTTTPTNTTTNTNKIAQTPIIPKTVTPKVVTPSTNVTPKPVTKNQPTQNTVIMTPQEEEIAWQVWRSNLQNRIMQDVKLPNVPQGTTFKFSFDVDKYGKITNVHTTSSNSAYTPYAIQFIAPVIKSYQGRSILNFPAGSKRTTTEFIGSFRINNSSNKYSTTNDYRDTERVIK